MHPLDIMNKSLTKTDIRKLNMERAAKTREGYIKGRRSLERQRKAAGAMAGVSGGAGAAGLALEAAKKYKIKLSQKVGAQSRLATGDLIRGLPEYKRRILQAKKYLRKVPKKLGYAVAAVGALGTAAGVAAHRRTKKKEAKLISMRENTKRLKKIDDEYRQYKKKKKKGKFTRTDERGGKIGSVLGGVYGASAGAIGGALVGMGREGRKVITAPLGGLAMSPKHLRRAAIGYLGGAALGAYGGAKAGARIGGGRRVPVKSNRKRSSR